MKRYFLLLVVLSLLLLAACDGSESAEIYDVEYQGKIYTVDQENQTITVDGNVCRYKMSSRGENVSLNVTYPDGSTYWWSQNGSSGMGGRSNDYDPDRYADGDDLWDVLNLDEDSSPNGYIGAGILLLLVGFVNTAAPHVMWYLGYGWRFKDAEPSDIALFMGRIGGIAAIITGVFCFFA